MPKIEKEKPVKRKKEVISVKIERATIACKEELPLEAVKSRGKIRSGRRKPQKEGGPVRPKWHSGKSGWRPSIAQWREKVAQVEQLSLKNDELEGKVAALRQRNEELDGKVEGKRQQVSDCQCKAETCASTAQALIEARKENDELKASNEDLATRLGKLASVNQDIQINREWAVQMARLGYPP